MLKHDGCPVVRHSDAIGGTTVLVYVLSHTGKNYPMSFGVSLLPK